jgi:hypothetical protein
MMSPTSGESYVAEDGVVLILADRALPFQESAETSSIHAVALMFWADDLIPAVVTMLPHPWDLDLPDIPLCTRVDQISYYHLMPFGPIPDDEESLVKMNVEALSPLIQRIRPSLLYVAGGRTPRAVGPMIGRLLGIPVSIETKSEG